MKTAVKSEVKVSSIGSVKRKWRRKISIPVDDIVTVISHLGDQISKLDHDGQWRSEKSLWSQMAEELTDKLSIENSSAVRKYIYSMWRRRTSKLRSHFISETLSNDMVTKLEELPSIPSYSKVCTRSEAASSRSTSIAKNKLQEHLIEFSYDEWRKVSFVH